MSILLERLKITSFTLCSIQHSPSLHLPDPTVCHAMDNSWNGWEFGLPSSLLWSRTGCWFLVLSEWLAVPEQEGWVSYWTGGFVLTAWHMSSVQPASLHSSNQIDYFWVWVDHTVRNWLLWLFWAFEFHWLGDPGAQKPRAARVGFQRGHSYNSTCANASKRFKFSLSARLISLLSELLIASMTIACSVKVASFLRCEGLKSHTGI